jgi:hypothetical protein
MGDSRCSVDRNDAQVFGGYINIQKRRRRVRKMYSYGYYTQYIYSAAY